MKVAIVHDDLMRRGGAEQVVLSMLRTFPGADLYTLCYQPELTYPEFKKYNIKTSWFNYVAKNERVMKMLFFPVGLLCMKGLSILKYDVVIISNTYCAKYVSIDRGATIFIYTYTPFRLAWNPLSYSEYKNSRGIRRIVFDWVVKILQDIDAKEAKKGDYFLSMTEETKERVRIAYKVKGDIHVIHPAVKCKHFYTNENSTKDYYLIVSRLEYYKNVDLAIKAFNQLGYKLIIVGNGSKRKELESMSNSNIEFRKGLSAKEIADLYANCKAFIFPQHEDYGITPLEANASGRPVVAYGYGGVLETMIPYLDKDHKFTSLFFYEQTIDSLIGAIRVLEDLSVDSEFISNHAKQFDEAVFVKELTDFVNLNLRTIE